MLNVASNKLCLEFVLRFIHERNEPHANRDHESFRAWQHPRPQIFQTMAMAMVSNAWLHIWSMHLPDLPIYR